MYIEHSLEKIAEIEKTLEAENLRFISFIRSFEDQALMDKKVQELNAIIEPQIDCLKCGNCCKTLMINVTKEECILVAKVLTMTVDEFKQTHIETSAEETYMVMNKMPCSFLQRDNCCSIYQNRFNECREFPQLKNPNFKSRTFSTMMHFGRCPIVYNVIQGLKKELTFV